MQARKHYELEIAFFLILILSSVYVAYDLLAEPRGSHPFGHWLGIIGTLLMIITETLYSLRKRTRLLNWAGPMRNWLSFHIVTGLVGPFLVLMHTGLHFRGLAGVTMALTAVIVLSGFIGRYLYTALQRNLGTINQSRQQIIDQIAELQTTLTQLEADKPTQIRQIGQELDQRISQQTRWGRWRYRRQLMRQLRQLEARHHKGQREIQHLQQQTQQLDQRQERVRQTRRLFQLWHMIHIPLGLTLFAAIAIHILATIYFRAGLFQ